ncbi:MAG TPA: hypothetical protein VMM18_15485 [Gemmatimonadaceae bacterium]|nr:hypothetical protein [Gemmatimonadaceae bacterium]
MSNSVRPGRIVRIAAGLIAGLLVPLAILLAISDLRRYWANALATLVVAGLFLYLAIRPDSLPFLDDPAVPDDR